MSPGTRSRFDGIVSAVLGFALVLGLMLVMNRQLGVPQRDLGESGSQIEVVRQEKPPPQQPIRKPEPPKRPQRRTSACRRSTPPSSILARVFWATAARW